MSTFVRLFADELAIAIEAEKKGDPETSRKHAERARMWSELHDDALARRASGKRGAHRA